MNTSVGHRALPKDGVRSVLEELKGGMSIEYSIESYTFLKIGVVQFVCC